MEIYGFIGVIMPGLFVIGCVFAVLTKGLMKRNLKAANTLLIIFVFAFTVSIIDFSLWSGKHYDLLGESGCVFMLIFLPSALLVLATSTWGTLWGDGGERWPLIVGLFPYIIGVMISWILLTTFTWFSWMIHCC